MYRYYHFYAFAVNYLLMQSKRTGCELRHFKNSAIYSILKRPFVVCENYDGHHVYHRLVDMSSASDYILIFSAAQSQLRQQFFLNIELIELFQKLEPYTTLFSSLIKWSESDIRSRLKMRMVHCTNLLEFTFHQVLVVARPLDRKRWVFFLFYIFTLWQTVWHFSNNA